MGSGYGGWDQYLQHTANLEQLVGSGQNAAARALVFGDATATMDSLDGSQDGLQKTLADGAHQDVQTSSDQIGSVGPVILAGLLVTILLGSLLALWLARSSASSLAEMASGMDALVARFQVGVGEGEVAFHPVSPRPESIAALRAGGHSRAA